MTAASRCGMWQRTHTWRPCKTWGNPNDPSKGCTSSREEVRGQRVTLATALCHLLLQVRTPGRHHRAGQPEPGVLCDSRGTGWHRAALEDPRGITARVFWAPVCLGCKRGLWAGMSSWGSGVWQEHPGDADAPVSPCPLSRIPKHACDSGSCFSSQGLHRLYPAHQRGAHGVWC